MSNKWNSLCVAFVLSIWATGVARGADSGYEQLDLAAFEATLKQVQVPSVTADDLDLRQRTYERGLENARLSGLRGSLAESRREASALVRALDDELQDVGERARVDANIARVVRLMTIATDVLDGYGTWRRQKGLEQQLEQFGERLEQLEEERKRSSDVNVIEVRPRVYYFLDWGTERDIDLPEGGIPESEDGTLDQHNETPALGLRPAPERPDNVAFRANAAPSLSFSDLIGANFGRSAAEFWASELVASGGGFRHNPLASTMLGFSVLWTPETWKYTLSTVALPVVPSAYAYGLSVLTRVGWNSAPALGAVASVTAGYYSTAWLGEPYGWEAAALDMSLGTIGGWSVGVLGRTASRIHQAFRGRNLAPYKYADLGSWTWGSTSWDGNVKLSRTLHPVWRRKHTVLYETDYRHWLTPRGPEGVLRHETVHYWLTPKGPFAASRQWIRSQGYLRNHFLRAFEEGLAEGAHFQSVAKGFKGLNRNRVLHQQWGWRWGLERDLIVRHGVESLTATSLGLTGAVLAGRKLADSEAYERLRKGRNTAVRQAPD